MPLKTWAQTTSLDLSWLSVLAASLQFCNVGLLDEAHLWLLWLWHAHPVVVAPQDACMGMQDNIWYVK